MSNNLDQLERLADLRRQGTLTEAEYQSQKDRLLSTSDRGGAAYWQRNRKWLTPLSAAIGVGIAIFVVKPLLSSTSGTGSQSSSDASSWTTSQTKDPMTDAVLKTATRTFESSTAKTEITITCGSDGLVSYRAVFFEPNGEAVALRPSFLPNGSPYASFQARLDTAPPDTWNLSLRDFNNVALLNPAPAGLDADTKRIVAPRVLPLLRAKRITFAFHLAHSDETIVIDQTDHDVARTVASCLSTYAPAGV